MATEIGVITGLNHDLAVVRTQRTTACDGCSERDACHSLGGGGEAEFEAKNPIHAKVGDQVVISCKTGQLLSLSFLLYIFPVIALIIGAVLGSHEAPGYGIDPSLAAAGCGFLLFAAAFGIIKLIDRRARKNGKYRPVIIRIKKSGQPPTADQPGPACCHPAR